MNILKLKSILLSLMAVVMLTVFLTSCEEDIIPDQQKVVNQEEVMSKMENDDDVSKLLDLTNQMREDFLNQAKKKNISAEEIMKAYESGNFEQLLQQLEVDMESFAIMDKEVKRTSQKVMKNYSKYFDNCVDCETKNTANKLESLEIMLEDNYLRGKCDSFWSWQTAKYAACCAACAVTAPTGFGYVLCCGVCYLSFCTDN